MNNYLNWILSALIGFVILFLARFYIKVYSLPRGPFPLPVIGNILLFRGTKKAPAITIANMKKTYGPVYTVWLAMRPLVFVSDLELIKQAFNSKNNEFMGRPKQLLQYIVTKGKGNDVILADYGPEWASLRRVAHSAARKLATSEKLLILASDSVIDTVNIIKKKEGINNAFNPLDYIYLIIFNIIAVSAFGKRYSIDDTEFIYIKKCFQEANGNFDSIVIVDLFPALKPFYSTKYNKADESMSTLSMMIQDKYSEHKQDYDKGVIRDFCDALIEAKEEAISEEKESAPYFNDYNLSFVIFDLFFAGSDTTNYTTRWVILLMANNSKMQLKMRKEIENVIGDRMPLHEDMKSCHYVMAFIHEVLRFRPVAPLSVIHRAMCDAKMGGYNIPEDTLITSLIWNIHHDPQYWTDPELFDPNRFISSDGKVVSTRNMPFIPFGIGRRVCLGEKLAMTDLFLITVCLLQSTSNYLIALPDGDGSADLEPDCEIIGLISPKPYKILFKNK